MDTKVGRANIGLFCFSLLVAEPGTAQTFFANVTEETFYLSLPDAGSSAVGDYDNDGWPDLFLTEFEGSRIFLLHNEGNGRFTHRLAEIPVTVSSKWKGIGATFGDYDNDGDLDLFVPVGSFRSAQRDLNMLLRNEDGVYVDITLEAGLTDHLPSESALWLDYDRDGYLDLYVGNRACKTESCREGDSEVRNKLYRNNGDGTFDDATEATGLNLQLTKERARNKTGIDRI